MIRLPYDLIEPIVSHFIMCMAESTTEDSCAIYWNAYNSYLQMVGWTDQEYDTELLKRIDGNWI